MQKPTKAAQKLANQLRVLRNAFPFQPFAVCMNNGHRYEVTQPEFMAISPVNDTFIVVDDDDAHILDIPHIQEIHSGNLATAK